MPATLEELVFAVTRVDPDAYDNWRDNGDAQEYTVHTGSGQPNGWHPTMRDAWSAYAEQLKAQAEETDRISDLAIETLAAVLEPAE